MAKHHLRVTQCPECNTSFHVTQVQLRAASGSVRCGSCLHVFDALSHMEDHPDTPANTPESPKADRPLSDEIDSSNPSQPLTEALETASQDTTTLEQGSEVLDTLLDTLDKEQIEVADTKNRHWPRLAGWSLLIAMCLFTLGLQYAWFNKDTLAMKPALQGIYQQVCEMTGCSLPLQIDTDQIKSQQLLVRSHPEVEGVLIVDAVIINNARTPQPWPLLALSFTDMNSQPVASRHFQAKEFLGGELAGSREIPSGQPIRLSLEIIDPGQDAVNYSLRFFPDKSLY